MNRKITRILRYKDNTEQRDTLSRYIRSHENWIEDTENEYLIGKSNESDEELLERAYQDAANKKYDILVVYSKDYISNVAWELCAFILAMKNIGMEIYTYTEGCITTGSILILPE